MRPFGGIIDMPHRQGAEATPLLAKAASTPAVISGSDAGSDALLVLGEALSAGEAPLEPESLIALAESRLNDLDGQIGAIMVDLQTRSQQVEGLGEKIQVLQAVRVPMVTAGSVKAGDKEDPTDLKLEWHGEEIHVDELLERYDISGVTHKKGKIPLGSIDERINQFQTEITGLNSGNELAMIGLQSLMSQRSQVVEMATRMLSSLSESQMAIIMNLR